LQKPDIICMWAENAPSPARLLAGEGTFAGCAHLCRAHNDARGDATKNYNATQSDSGLPDLECYRFADEMGAVSMADTFAPHDLCASLSLTFSSLLRFG
jgi:hypothetical protein